MFENHQDLQRDLERLPADGRGPVGLVTVGDEFWIVLADDGDPLLDAPIDPEFADPTPMCVGHAVDAEGRLRIRRLDPERASMLTEILIGR